MATLTAEAENLLNLTVYLLHLLPVNNASSSRAPQLKPLRVFGGLGSGI